jgi:catechol 2,3-dioxygenase-like lactoylglutathione lyase family enzyme
VRASITAATRPSPWGSKAQPADHAGAAEDSSTRLAAVHEAQRNACVVVTLLTVRTDRYAAPQLLSEKATQGEMMEMNGIAHIFLTASNYHVSREFYRKLLPFLGLKPVIDTETTYYCVGGRTAVGISAPSAEHEGAAFEQKRVGLHHLCFRARERADIDEFHVFLGTINAKIIRAPREDQWAPGYYSILFEDPDGIRLELNHVPGKGLLG